MAWSHETIERLEHIEPLLPAETYREAQGGKTGVLAWKESPKAAAVCMPSGELALEGVEISAGELIELPRLSDEPQEFDTDPGEQLSDLFSRLGASLSAWSQALDHLRPEKR
jgi:hypothetical protein